MEDEQGEVLEKDFEWIVREKLDEILKILKPKDDKKRMTKEEWEELFK